MKHKILTVIAFTVTVVILIIGGMVTYKTYNLKIKKTDSVKRINAGINYSDYRDAERKQVESIADYYANKVYGAESIEEVSSKVNAANSDISKIKTDKILKEEESESESIVQAEIESKRQVELAKKRAEEYRKKMEKESKKKAEKESKKKAKKEAQKKQTLKRNNQQVNYKARVNTNNSYKGRTNNTGGCVGNDAKNFY